jgi:hypothetical protein
MHATDKRRWIREQQMIASLDMVYHLCARHCRSIAAACLRLRDDPIYGDVLERDGYRLSSVATKLLEEPAHAQGTPMLRLAVTRRLLLQVMDRKEVVVWLARDHPETLSILLNATDFDELGVGDFEEDPLPVAKPGRRRIKASNFR